MYYRRLIPYKFLPTLLLLFAVASAAVPQSASAQNRSEIDTLRFAGLGPGMRTGDMFRATQHLRLDTMLWGGDHGASIYSFTGKMEDEPGEYRIATDPLGVTQITFVASTNDSSQSAVGYQHLTALLQSHFGEPDENYTNGLRFMTWHGAKQDLSVKTIDGKNYLVATLTSNVVAKAVPSKEQSPATDDGQVRRKRN